MEAGQLDIYAVISGIVVQAPEGAGAGIIDKEDLFTIDHQRIGQDTGLAGLDQQFPAAGLECFGVGEDERRSQSVDQYAGHLFGMVVGVP